MSHHPVLKFAHKVDSALNAIGRALAGRPLESAIKNARYARQRVTRGWDDTATWSLDTHLGRTLGAQLNHLADTAHGYPGTGAYQDFESWQRDLRLHGDALTRYAAKVYEYDEEIDHQQLLDDAKAAMHWVADNFESLWD